MSETKKITNIITPNGEDLQLTDSEAVHKENNIITEKITLANQLEFVPSNENTDSSLPTPVLFMDETNGGLRIDGRVAQGSLTNIAGGANSHVEGQETIASASYSHAEGYKTFAKGNASHAEGVESKVVIINSDPNNTIGGHAEGHDCEVRNRYSHAEGEVTKASGRASHSEGEQYAEDNIVYNTMAIGLGSHAEGGGTQTGDSTDSTKGSYAHSEGILTKAIYEGSHAEGYNTKTSKVYQHVSGQYNADNSNALFIIGNGTSDTNRKNVLEVLEDGTINLSSDKAKITNVADPTNIYDAVNKQYVDTQANYKYTSINKRNQNSGGFEYTNNISYSYDPPICEFQETTGIPGTYGTINFFVKNKKFKLQLELNSGFARIKYNGKEEVLEENQIYSIDYKDIVFTDITIEIAAGTRLFMPYYEWYDQPLELTNGIISGSEKEKIDSKFIELEQRIAALEQQLAAQSNL